ncbi:alanine--tRNA ligase [Candidatus Peregrinibacteria bacterium]|nr:alanine--tRNA ligase [Candidatus Peregrinibacteria bacterium]
MTPTANQIRRQYIDFFVKNYKHKEIPSASLIPENDPTVLFTTAGMHPLVPYLLGEPHPSGKRLVNAQKCVRTDDIDEVGDATHLTFFEMLGNWSLGDYFKEGAIKMSFELLTLPWEKGGFGLPARRLFVSCFEGDKDAPKDTESAEIWEKLGIPTDRIFFFPKKKNWWGPAGQTGPCGPDTEMFYDVLNDPDFAKHKPGFEGLNTKCDPSCDCGRYVEVWNDVFMQYNKNAEPSAGSGQAGFSPLKQQNVDTGLGFERLVGILSGKSSPFETELFEPVMEKIAKLSGTPDAGSPDYVRSSRIIADHLRAATFILGDPFGVSPSNIDQGYVVRRLIRRAIRHGKLVGINGFFTSEIARIFIPIYGEVYPELVKNSERIVSELSMEEERFSHTIERGLHELKKTVQGKAPESADAIDGKKAFYIFETYGFPLEMIVEELAKDGFKIPREQLIQIKKDFDESYKKHQELSRAGAEKKFSGGLADDSEKTTMHHTATHLLHQALRDVLGPHVAQKGSNVTKERLRFDFSHPSKMTPEQIKKVEEIVNEQIKRNLPVHYEMLTVEEAKAKGAIGLFEEKYAALGNQVKVYFIGPSAGSGQAVYSCEICGGPHIGNTGDLKHFKILKEEASSAGVRRIKAVVGGIK